MATISCPICHQNNPAANGYCGSCGAALPIEGLIVSSPAPLRIRDNQLATRQAKALAVTMALGVATLLAEAGLAYLQRRLSRMERSSLSLRKRKSAVKDGSPIVPANRPNGRVITVVGERVIEEKRWGRPARRIVERFAWRGEEHNSR